MRKNRTTCVVIADGARAKFLVKNTNNLMPIIPTHHAADDVTVHQDMGASTPGKMSKGMTNHGLHSYPPHSDWYQFQKEAFATEIANILHSTEKNYDQFILIASPFVLGLLRQHLSPHVISKVIYEINKDLTKLPLKTVFKVLTDKEAA